MQRILGHASITITMDSTGISTPTRWTPGQAVSMMLPARVVWPECGQKHDHEANDDPNNKGEGL